MVSWEGLEGRVVVESWEGARGGVRRGKWGSMVWGLDIYYSLCFGL